VCVSAVSAGCQRGKRNRIAFGLSEQIEFAFEFEFVFELQLRIEL